ncbi:hypothetical protein C7447_10149 [Tenacibaculum adriaticum]|uniref:Uncharacterized protein n=1 Tax=Tenacibaculum adriaticum TaxID=413713 RepID=A0A5S5DU32_9FLAO|nr:hypothetical protein C7447_10149 [Tenacibaculum adriaticum]
MKFERRFGNQKKTNPKRGLFLVVLLIIVLYLFFNADKIIGRFL